MNFCFFALPSKSMGLSVTQACTYIVNLFFFTFRCSFDFFNLVCTVIECQILSQVRHGWSCHDGLLSTAFGVGTIYQGPFSCTTQTLSPRRKATFTLLYAMCRSLLKLQSTMICIIFLGIFLPNSIPTLLILMTQAR